MHCVTIQDPFAKGFFVTVLPLRYGFQNSNFSKIKSAQSKCFSSIATTLYWSTKATILTWFKEICKRKPCTFEKRQRPPQSLNAHRSLKRTQSMTDLFVDRTLTLLKFPAIHLENCWLQRWARDTTRVTILSHRKYETQTGTRFAHKKCWARFSVIQYMTKCLQNSQNKLKNLCSFLAKTKYCTPLFPESSFLRDREYK